MCRDMNRNAYRCARKMSVRDKTLGGITSKLHGDYLLDAKTNCKGLGLELYQIKKTPIDEKNIALFKDYCDWLKRGSFDFRDGELFGKFYGKRPLWKTKLSQGFIMTVCNTPHVIIEFGGTAGEEYKDSYINIHPSEVEWDREYVLYGTRRGFGY